MIEPPPARHLGRAPPLFMLRRAAQAPPRSRPLSSNESPFMITTSHPKLPRFARWPIASAQLKECAELIVTTSPIEATFFDYKVHELASADAARRVVHTVLRVTFYRRRGQEGEWSFLVRPVPAAVAPRVRALVDQQVLPRLKAWLIRTPEPDRRSTRPMLAFTCTFDETKDALAIDEN